MPFVDSVDLREVRAIRRSKIDYRGESHDDEEASQQSRRALTLLAASEARSR
jgi:hypothetical protein